MVAFTNEAIEFLLLQKIVIVVGGKLALLQNFSKSKINRIATIDPEIGECVQKAEHVGRWFYNMQSEGNVYAAWGVKP